MADMHFPEVDMSAKDLKAEVESYRAGAGFYWPTFFPLKYSPKFDITSLSGKDGLPIAAERVAFSTKAPLKTRRTVGAWSGKLDKIAISREKDEIEVNEWKDKKKLVAGTDDEAAKQELIDSVYEDPAFCATGMDAKVELDSLYIATHGVYDFPAIIDGENATADTINFKIPEENFSGASKAWDNLEEADGIGDIIRMVKVIRKKGKRVPRYAIMEQAAFDNLSSQAKTIKRLSSFATVQNGSLVTIDADAIDIDRVNAYMRKKGYPTILVIDAEVANEDKAGDEVPIKPWAENVVVLSVDIQLGWTYWKTVPKAEHTDALQEYGPFYKITCYSELNPLKEVAMAEAYLQPVLINRNSMCLINTAKTTWSNGSAD